MVGVGESRAKMKEHHQVEEHSHRSQIDGEKLTKGFDSGVNVVKLSAVQLNTLSGCLRVLKSFKSSVVFSLASKKRELCDSKSQIYQGNASETRFAGCGRYETTSPQRRSCQRNGNQDFDGRMVWKERSYRLKARSIRWQDGIGCVYQHSVTNNISYRTL